MRWGIDMSVQTVVRGIELASRKPDAIFAIVTVSESRWSKGSSGRLVPMNCRGLSQPKGLWIGERLGVNGLLRMESHVLIRERNEGYQD